MSGGLYATSPCDQLITKCVLLELTAEDEVAKQDARSTLEGVI